VEYVALPEWSVPEPSEAGELQFADVQVEKFTVPVGFQSQRTWPPLRRRPQSTKHRRVGAEVSTVVVATMVTTWVTTLEVLALNEPWDSFVYGLDVGTTTRRPEVEYVAFPEWSIPEPIKVGELQLVADVQV